MIRSARVRAINKFSMYESKMNKSSNLYFKAYVRADSVISEHFHSEYIKFNPPVRTIDLTVYR